jgi:hypothetical protein
MQQDNFLNIICQLENASHIVTTEEYVGSKTIESDLTFKDFKPGLFNKIFGLCLFGLPLIFIVYYGFHSRTLTGSKIGGMAVVGIFMIIGLVSAINQFFNNKSQNYKIQIDSKGISIDDTLYQWDDIYKTAIMQKGTGKNSRNCLLLAFNDMSSYEYYDLSNFIILNMDGFSLTLAKYIEYFKPKNKRLRPTNKSSPNN